jgi:TonB family protein
VFRNPTSKPRSVHIRKGEKSTHYPLIAFEILESGQVTNARVKHSSGVADLDALALKSVRGMKFNNRPGCGTVESEVTVLMHPSR